MRRVDYRALRRKHRRRVINRWIIGIIVVLGLATIFVLNIEPIESFMARTLQTVELSQNGKNIHKKSKHKASYNFKQVRPISPATIAQAYVAQSGYHPAGQLAIDNLRVHCNVYEGIGNTELNLGVGTLKPNQKMGKKNYAIAGHNMDDGKTYLSPLYAAKRRGILGNQVVLLTDFKNVYYYQIIASDFISRYDTKLISDDGFEKHPVLTMITCDATGSGRLAVIASYTGQQKLSKASKNVQRSFVLK